jgi:hypothetical protein
MTHADELAALLSRHDAFGRVRYGHVEPGAPLGPGVLAAENLQEKVLLAVERGDEDRAERLLARMAQLPVEPQIEVRPALWIAHNTLFMAITDDLEDAGEDDDSWLEHVLRVLDGASPFGRRIIVGVLRSIMQDYELTPRERRRGAAAIEAAGVEPWDPYDLSADETEALDRVAIAREGGAVLSAYTSA